MKTQALLTGICLTIAPWAAAAQSAPCCEGELPAAQTVALSPMSLNLSAAPRPAAALAPAAVEDKGMIGVYLAEDSAKALVDGLVSGGPAEQAGMQAGDRIVAVNGKKVTGWEALSQRMQDTHAGQQISVTVERDGWRKDFELTLGAAPDAPGTNAAEAPSSGFFFEEGAAPKAGAKALEKRMAIEKKIAGKGNEAEGNLWVGEWSTEAPDSPMTLRMRKSPDAQGNLFDTRIVELHAPESGAEDSDCCEGDEDCCAESVTVLGDGQHVIKLENLRLNSPQVLGLGQLPGGAKGKAKIVIRTDDGEEHVKEIEFGGAGNVQRWVTDGDDGEKHVEVLVQGLDADMRENIEKTIRQRIEMRTGDGGRKMLLFGGDHEGHGKGGPVGIEVEVEHDGAHGHPQVLFHSQGKEGLQWFTPKANVTKKLKVPSQDEWLNIQHDGEWKVGPGGTWQGTWTGDDDGHGVFHLFSGRDDDDDDHHHDGHDDDDEHHHGGDDHDDDVHELHRRLMSTLATPPAPPAPRGAPRAGGDLRELRQQLNDLRQELKELRKALRRVQAGGGR